MSFTFKLHHKGRGGGGGAMPDNADEQCIGVLPSTRPERRHQ